MSELQTSVFGSWHVLNIFRVAEAWLQPGRLQMLQIGISADPRMLNSHVGALSKLTGKPKLGVLW